MSDLQELQSHQSSSNFELTLQVENLKEQLEETTTEKESVQNQMEHTQIQHAEEKLKLEAQHAQQAKLIDLLQNRVDIQPGKKNKVRVKACLSHLSLLASWRLDK